jgi:predicted metal-dependent HD superfamily phosphohydrolase
MNLEHLLNAERFFLRALVLDPEFDQAHLHLGDLYRGQEKHYMARFHYGRVLEVSTNARAVARAKDALEPTLSP